METIRICGKNAKKKIYGDAQKDIKKRINLIAINKSEILLGHYYKNETIVTEEFIIYLKELIKIIGTKNIKSHVIILDNASYHFRVKLKNL